MTKALISSGILLHQFSRYRLKAIALALVLASATLAAFASKPTVVADRRSSTAFASTITSFSPSSGAPGTLVTVTGSGFTSASTLTIGGKPAIVTSFTATQIVGMVMPGAVTGKVVVASVSSATDFTVTATPYPAFQQGAKLIDTTIQYGPYNVKQTSALAADGNSALVNIGSSYLFYTRKNKTWTVSSAFIGSNGYRTVSNYLALSADGSTALIGDDAGPAKLYKRNNSAWQNAGTLNDSLGNVVGLSADGKTAILGKNAYGGSYSGGETGLGITIMKLVGNTWQKQEVADVPNYTEEHVYFGMIRFDEEGNVTNTPQYYTVGRGSPGNRVAISADGKTVAASSFQNAGRYNRLFNLGYTAIYKLSSTGWEVQAVLPEYRDFKFSADGNTFLTGGLVYVRNGAVWSLQQTLPYGRGAMSADGNTIVFAAPAPTAFIRTGGGWVQKEIPAPNPAAVATENTLNNIALSADGATAFFEVPDDATRKGQSGLPLGSITVYGTEPYNPLDYATTISFSNTTATTTTLSWPRGNGTTDRAVFLKMGTAGLPAAINGTAYTPDSSFMSFNSWLKTASVAATGWYCVYNGKGGYVNISGLRTGTTYTASVVEYTGSAGAETYQVTGVTTRVTTPVVAPNYYTFVRATPGKNPATMMNIEYSPNGPMPVGIAIFVKEIGLASSIFYPYNYSEIPLPGTASYAANNKFGTGEQIGGSGWFCVYNGEYSPNAIGVTGLRPGAYYRVVAVNYNGSKSNPVHAEPDYRGSTGDTYRTNSFDPPTGYATALTFSNTTATSSTLIWTNGTGASRAVFIKAGSLGAPEGLDVNLNSPEASNPYTLGNPVYQQSGNTDWYCVYAGTGSSVNLLGLSPSTTYRVVVVDYNGGDGASPAAFVARFNGANVTTTAPVGAPATPPIGYATAYVFSNTAATSTTLSWVSSNGTARAVFLKKGTSGALNVLQGHAYAASNIFSLGDMVGTNGWYCIYNGTGSSVSIAGLSASTAYRAIVLEYNKVTGVAGTEGYNLSRYNGANVTTTVAPALILTTNQKRLLVEQDVLADNATPELNIHQGLSPNGDGQNDVFTIDGLAAYPQNTVKIINSNGDVIYTASGYDNYLKAFDGHSANGTLQKAGTYFYSLEYKKGADTIRKTGYLVIKY